MVQLSELVKFVSGSPQFRITETDDMQAPTYFVYSQEDLMSDLVGIELEKTENKVIRTNDEVRLLFDGDFVFSLISGKASIVRKKHEGYLYTQNYIKLMPGDKLVPEFLIYLLNENLFVRKQFQMGLQGSMVLKYTLKQLREIEIMQLPSLSKQKQIGEIYLKQLKVQALKKRVADWETKIALNQLEEVMKR